MSISDEYLAKLERLLESASPAPWTVEMDDENGEVRGIDANPAGMLSDRIVETDGGMYGPNPQDAAFIAEARTAMPLLIAEVRRLQAERNALKDIS